MIDEKYLSKDYGLLNSTYGREGTDENGPLYSVEYDLVSGSAVFRDALFSFYNICWTGVKGLYHQRPNNNGSKEDYTSPDQLIAMVAYHNGQLEHKVAVDNIWRYLKRHLFTYDNLQPNKINFRRFMQPMAIGFVGYSATGNRLCKQIMLLACRKACKEFEKEDNLIERLKELKEIIYSVISSSRDTNLAAEEYEELYNKRKDRLNGKDPLINWESSGVLKAFTCLRSLGIRDEYCEKFYDKAFEVYYPDENHPIRREL